MQRGQIGTLAADALTRLVFGYPGRCALCGRPLSSGDPGSPGVCGDCISRLAREMSRVCVCCGVPITSSLGTCPHCRRNLYAFDAQRSAGVYRGDLREAVLRLKHRGERWLSRPLGYLLWQISQEFYPLDMVIPVPLEPESFRNRGYNQALDLAKEISKRADIPLVVALTRDGKGSRQAGLGRDMRWRNLEGSMGLASRLGFSGKRCLVVDDVATTGATLHEAARVLRSAGASRVFGVTVARAEVP